jgi:hypothetical protein
MPTNITLNRNIHLRLLSLSAVGFSGLRVVLPPTEWLLQNGALSR